MALERYTLKQIDTLIANARNEICPDDYEFNPETGQWEDWVPLQYDNGEFTRELMHVSWPPPYTTSLNYTLSVIDPLVIEKKGNFTMLHSIKPTINWTHEVTLNIGGKRIIRQAPTREIACALCLLGYYGVDVLYPQIDQK